MNEPTEIRFRVQFTNEDTVRVEGALAPFDEWSLIAVCASFRDLFRSTGGAVVEWFRTSPLPATWHGPFKGLTDAQNAAQDLVGEPFTEWAVIELFGDGFDRPATDGSDETWGELWVVPEPQMQALSETKGAVTYQCVGSAGYTETENTNER